MRALQRYGRFLTVGAMGMAVQLGSVAVLGRWLAGHALVASGLALKLTLLHNFVWHLRWTWRDRAGAWPGLLVRFHVANGLVSMLGSLVLVRMLAGRIPLVVVNLVAIGCCSALNFGVGHVWAFRGRAPSGAEAPGSAPSATAGVKSRPSNASEAEAAAMAYLRARPLAQAK